MKYVLILGIVLIASCGKKTEAPKDAAPAETAAGKAGIQWVSIPGGSFTMVGPPPRQVTVKSFQMAKTLVTNKLYKACVDAGACTPTGSIPSDMQGDDQPLICVDWHQAKAFSEWVGGRLPSEAEWEYASRSAGKHWEYPWGNEKATCERAVIDEGGKGCGKNATWPVCSKPAGNTTQGLCDMAGDALEWVQDWYHRDFDGAPTDGSAWESPAGSSRVLRGGSWDLDAGFARTYIRLYADPGNRYTRRIGFRPAR